MQASVRAKGLTAALWESDAQLVDPLPVSGIYVLTVVKMCIWSTVTYV